GLPAPVVARAAALLESGPRRNGHAVLKDGALTPTPLPGGEGLWPPRADGEGHSPPRPESEWLSRPHSAAYAPLCPLLGDEAHLLQLPDGEPDLLPLPVGEGWGEGQADPARNGASAPAAPAPAAF